MMELLEDRSEPMVTLAMAAMIESDFIIVSESFWFKLEFDFFDCNLITNSSFYTFFPGFIFPFLNIYSFDVSDAVSNNIKIHF